VLSRGSHLATSSKDGIMEYSVVLVVWVQHKSYFDVSAVGADFLGPPFIYIGNHMRQWFSD